MSGCDFYAFLGSLLVPVVLADRAEAEDVGRAIPDMPVLPPLPVTVLPARAPLELGGAIKDCVSSARC